MLEQLTPAAEAPFFFGKIGKTFPAEGERRYRVAFLAGCIANVAFARLNEATVRVLQKNGCEVASADQTCCGALHVHAGLREEARAGAAQHRRLPPGRLMTPSSPTPPAAAPP
jgi:glycolate oxidase iron-sulfur subunit